jgi:hypothetical protein
MNCVYKTNYEFWLLTKMALQKVVRPLEIYRHTKLHGPALTATSKKLERPPF